MAVSLPTSREASLVESVVDRMHAEFGIDRDEILARATEVFATFADARVQTFVGILVEKALRTAYREISRTVPQE